MPTIMPSRRSTKTRPRLGCSKINRKPRSCLSLSGRKSLSCEKSAPSISDNSSKSASVAGSMTTFSLTVSVLCIAYSRNRSRLQPVIRIEIRARDRIDNPLLHPKVTALQFAPERILRPYETDLSTFENELASASMVFAPECERKADAPLSPGAVSGAGNVCCRKASIAITRATPRRKSSRVRVRRSSCRESRRSVGASVRNRVPRSLTADRGMLITQQKCAINKRHMRESLREISQLSF